MIGLCHWWTTSLQRDSMKFRHKRLGIVWNRADESFMSDTCSSLEGFQWTISVVVEHLILLSVITMLLSEFLTGKKNLRKRSMRGSSASYQDLKRMRCKACSEIRNIITCWIQTCQIQLRPYGFFFLHQLSSRWRWRWGGQHFTQERHRERQKGSIKPE